MRSPISKRPRLDSASSSSGWVIEEVSPTKLCTPAQETAHDQTMGFSSDDVVKLLTSMQGHKIKPSQFNNQMNNVVPEFDPHNKTQSVDIWIRKVNECSSIYEWDEKQTIHFALQKLTGLAKKWFEALPTVVYTWEEWQVKLRKAFPNEYNYGQLLEEMLARTTRRNENLSDYFYDKLTLINRCNVQGKNAVDCVIHGIVDKSIRNSAQALNCEEPEDLLNFLNSQKSIDIPYFKKPILPVGNRPGTISTTSGDVTCFNCRSKGHTFYKCPKPLIKCQKCRRVGHDLDACKLEPIRPRIDDKPPNLTAERSTLLISSGSTNDKFFKKAAILDQNLVAYVDFGSECSLMRER